MQSAHKAGMSLCYFNPLSKSLSDRHYLSSSQLPRTLGLVQKEYTYARDNFYWSSDLKVVSKSEKVPNVSIIGNVTKLTVLKVEHLEVNIFTVSIIILIDFSIIHTYK